MDIQKLPVLVGSQIRSQIFLVVFCFPSFIEKRGSIGRLLGKQQYASSGTCFIDLFYSLKQEKTPEVKKIASELIILSFNQLRLGAH